MLTPWNAFARKRLLETGAVQTLKMLAQMAMALVSYSIASRIRDFYIAVARFGKLLENSATYWLHNRYIRVVI